RGYLDHAGDVGDRAELLLAAVREERHVLEMGDLLVMAHARPGGLGPAKRVLQILRDGAVQDATDQFHAISSSVGTLPLGRGPPSLLVFRGPGPALGFARAPRPLEPPDTLLAERVLRAHACGLLV